MILYNFPARTGTDLTPELVASLAAKHPNICGIKDTVDTISHTRKVIRAARAVNPDFTVFSGFVVKDGHQRFVGVHGLCFIHSVGSLKWSQEAMLWSVRARSSLRGMVREHQSLGGRHGSFR